MTARQAYFRAMQIPVWRLRPEFRPPEADNTGANDTAVEDERNAAELSTDLPIQALSQQPGDQGLSLPDAVSADASPFPDEVVTAAPIAAEKRPSEAEVNTPPSWESLQQQVRDCQACELCHSRTQTVFGVGDRQADWLLVGEAPGADEDRLGEPFVGRAGQLLTEMIFALGFTRQQVYIANILKCRPPDNRDPSPAESQQCIGFLQQQIALIQPKIILAVGKIAAQNLLGIDRGMSMAKMRGQQYRYGEQGIPTVVTYHPSYLLRSPLEKRRSWDDLLLAQSVMGEKA